MIEVFVDRKHGVTLMRASGEIEAREVDVAIERAYAAKPTLDSLWDFRQADSSGLLAEDFERFAATMARLSHDRQGGRVAFLCGNEIVASVLQMYMTVAEYEQVPLVHRLFLDEVAALEWLGQPLDLLRGGEGESGARGVDR